ncbi:hypothetical protein EVG20_g8197 [Dentipellis fragilis]|uniref:F-box domain-containing protein n=1 Tax=Dentipellis fragilis TaxID=205917 RepID=A0A4Y9Y8D1_9AGAM|nr:hypothetical protein EVG20_g8197 [Dentipellis fragilis]
MSTEPLNEMAAGPASHLSFPLDIFLIILRDLEVEDVASLSQLRIPMAPAGMTALLHWPPVSTDVLVFDLPCSDIRTPRWRDGCLGSHLLQELLTSPQFNRVGKFGRHVTTPEGPEQLAGLGEAQNAKLRKKAADFENIEREGLKDGMWSSLPYAYVLLCECSLGTNAKKAGSSANFEKIGREYVMNTAKAAQSADLDHPQRLGYVSVLAKSHLFGRSWFTLQSHALGYSDTVIFLPAFLMKAEPKSRLQESLIVSIASFFSHFCSSVGIDVAWLAKSIRIAGQLGSEKLPPQAQAEKRESPSGKPYVAINNSGALKLAEMDASTSRAIAFMCILPAIIAGLFTLGRGCTATHFVAVAVNFVTEPGDPEVAETRIHLDGSSQQRRVSTTTCVPPFRGRYSVVQMARGDMDVVRNKRQCQQAQSDFGEARCRSESSIQNLPNETLEHIFLELTWIYIPRGVYTLRGGQKWIHLGWISVTHVSRRWRKVALNNMFLWKTICYDLGRRWVQEILSNTDVLFQIIPEHLSHVRWLHIYADRNAFPQTTFEHLHRPAPVLFSLIIRCGEDKPHVVAVVPSDIFAGHTPKLRRIDLSNVFVPWSSPIFKNLPHTPDIYPSRADLLVLLEKMPCLEHLRLANVVPKSSLEAAALRAYWKVPLPNLQVLHLTGPVYACFDLLRYLDYPSTTSVELICNCEGFVDDTTGIIASQIARHVAPEDPDVFRARYQLTCLESKCG